MQGLEGLTPDWPDNLKSAKKSADEKGAMQEYLANLREKINGKARGSRGSVLDEAKSIINGERQDVYGNPEDSFALIADYWNVYLSGLGGDHVGVKLGAGDVALMMTLFKVAREANMHKRDNIRDAAGYLGIYADMEVTDAVE